jgi:polysaccharide chain length determinant protein (PEP-CTERM system associated)
MVNTPEPFDIQRYFKIGQRRKWYIIIPFTLSVAISFGVYTYLPKVYRATTVMWFQGAKVAEGYVKGIYPAGDESTLKDVMTARVDTISQEILSTRLESVIKEFNLYPDIRDKLPMEDIAGMMKKNIEVKVELKQNIFSISFEGTKPETVLKVTNKLASMFIEENLKSREIVAGATVDFISKELQKAEWNVKKGEEAVRRLKEKHMGQLPELLGTNLGILQRLEQQLKTASDNLIAAEERIVLLESQIAQLTVRSRGSLTQGEDVRSEQGREDASVELLNTLKRDLANAEFKYTETHPDVVALRRKIASLELRLKKQEGEREKRIKEVKERKEEILEASPLLDPATEKLFTQYKGQLKAAQSEASRLKEEMGSLKEQMARYQKRIEETPMTEQAMAQLNRDNERLRSYYQSLVDKKYQSQLAANLELKRQGEQIRIFEPARLPNRPYKPDPIEVLAIGALLGLAIGSGLVWFRESADRSFYEVSEVETYLKLPVLATILNLNEEEKKAA